MTKPFHPGAAARAGLTSALFAKHGFTASPRAIEAPRGLAQTYLDQVRLERDHRRARHSASRSAFNTYKPFACGIVIHPAIDGCVQLRNAHGLAADGHRAHRRCSVHPLVLELTGKTAPRTGLEGKFSVYHACAAGIMLRPCGRSGVLGRTSSRAPT